MDHLITCDRCGESFPDHHAHECRRGSVIPRPLMNPEPTNEPQAGVKPPQRDPAQILATYRTNLDWAIDCASLKLNRLKEGSSAWKTQRGVLRGLQEAKGALDSEVGA